MSSIDKQNLVDLRLERRGSPRTPLPSPFADKPKSLSFSKRRRKKKMNELDISNIVEKTGSGRFLEAPKHDEVEIDAFDTHEFDDPPSKLGNVFRMALPGMTGVEKNNRGNSGQNGFSGQLRGLRKANDSFRDPIRFSQSLERGGNSQMIRQIPQRPPPRRKTNQQTPKRPPPRNKTKSSSSSSDTPQGPPQRPSRRPGGPQKKVGQKSSDQEYSEMSTTDSFFKDVERRREEARKSREKREELKSRKSEEAEGEEEFMTEREIGELSAGYLQNLQKNVKTLNTEISRLSTENEQYKKKLDLAYQNEEEAKLKLNLSKMKITGLKEEHEKSLRENLEIIKRLKSSLSEAQTNMKDLKLKKSQLEQSNEQSSGQMASQIAKLKKRMKEEENRNSKNLEELRKKRSIDIDQKSQEIRTLKSLLEKLEEEIEENKSKHIKEIKKSKEVSMREIELQKKKNEEIISKLRNNISKKDSKISEHLEESKHIKASKDMEIKRIQQKVKNLELRLKKRESLLSPEKEETEDIKNMDVINEMKDSSMNIQVEEKKNEMEKEINALRKRLKTSNSENRKLKVRVKRIMAEKKKVTVIERKETKKPEKSWFSQFCGS